MTSRYDLLLRNGEVIDPASGRSGRNDLAVAGGRIAAIAETIPAEEADRVIDVTGRIVVPGLIDMHAHVLHGVTEMALDADTAGVRSGVTTLVDAGSAGPATFGAFPHWIIPSSRTRIVPFLHVGRTGLATSPDIQHQSDLDTSLIARVLATYEGLIAGIKVRMVSPAIEVLGIDMLRTAKSLARDAGIPVMVHVGDILQRADPELGRTTLDLLEPGDIVTHVFTPNPGGVIGADGRVFPEVFAAAERGVLFDAAHGRSNFGFDVARRVLDQGVPLASISTDMTRLGRSDIVFSMTEIMSRYLGLGFTVGQIIEMSTSKPAGAVGIADRAGRLEVGRVADVSVLEIRDGDWTVHDAVGDAMRLSRAFVPTFAVLGGDVIEPEFGPHPWGWEPTRTALTGASGG